LEKLNETANLGIAHLKESEEAKAKEKQVNQRREQVREWTRQIA
jgi:hypothetical protein